MSRVGERWPSLLAFGVAAACGIYLLLVDGDSWPRAFASFWAGLLVLAGTLHWILTPAPRRRA